MGSCGDLFDLEAFAKDLRDVVERHGLTVAPCALESVAGAVSNDYYGIAFRRQHDIQRDSWRMQALMRLSPKDTE